MKKIALFSKPGSPEAWGVLNEIMAWARLKGIETLVGAGPAGGWTSIGWDIEFCNKVRHEADLAIAIGGDGTLLGVARSLFGWDKPVLGVNLGTLGFLTEVSARNIEKMFDQLTAQEYYIEERILLETEPQPGLKGLAFNDVVLGKVDAGRLAEFDVFVDGVSVYSLRADGLIVTTPTGSTAYSMAANGPILHPSLDAVALVPLCPHSLTAKPITLPSASRIEVRMGSGAPCRVYCDAQPVGDVLKEGEQFLVTQASSKAKMLHFPEYSLFKTLQTKLNWAIPNSRG